MSKLPESISGNWNNLLKGMYPDLYIQKEAKPDEIKSDNQIILNDISDAPEEEDECENPWDLLTEEQKNTLIEESRRFELLPPPVDPRDEEPIDFVHFYDPEWPPAEQPEAQPEPEAKPLFIKQTAKPKENDSVWSILCQRQANPINLDFVLSAALKGQKLPERDQILPGLLYPMVGLIAGAGASGKTMFSIQTALCLSMGKDIFGFYSREFMESDLNRDEKPWKMKERKVVYLSLEDDEETILYRIHDIITFIRERQMNKDRRYMDIDTDILAQKIKENVKIFDLSGFGSAAWLAGPAIDEAKRREIENDIVSKLKGKGYNIIFIDTKRRSHGYQETDDSGANLLMGMAERIARELNCAVILIAHTTKESSMNGNIDPESIRGSSVYKDNGRWATVIAGVGIQRDKNNKRIKVDERIRVKYVRHGIPKANHIKNWPEGWLERGKGGVLFRTSDDVDGFIQCNMTKEEIFGEEEDDIVDNFINIKQAGKPKTNNTPAKKQSGRA